MAPLSRLVELEHDQLAELVESWDFNPGKKFQDKVLADLGAAVHHPSSSPAGSFSLLGAGCVPAVHLQADGGVGQSRPSCLPWGTPAGFQVSFVNERHFRFAVSCRSVGFKVCDLKRIITAHFDVYFHLFRDGGASWIREEKRWRREEEQSWTKVTHKKKKVHGKRVAFCKKLVQDSPVKLSKPLELQDASERQQAAWTIKFGSFTYEVSDDILAAERPNERQVHGSSVAPSERSASTEARSHGEDGRSRPEVFDKAVQIPVDGVYSNLRRDLLIDEVVGHNTSSEVHAPVQQPSSLNTSTKFFRNDGHQLHKNGDVDHIIQTLANPTSAQVKTTIQ